MICDLESIPATAEATCADLDTDLRLVFDIAGNRNHDLPLFCEQG